MHNYNENPQDHITASPEVTGDLYYDQFAKTFDRLIDAQKADSISAYSNGFLRDATFVEEDGTRTAMDSVVVGAIEPTISKRHIARQNAFVLQRVERYAADAVFQGGEPELTEYRFFPLDRSRRFSERMGAHVMVVTQDHEQSTRSVHVGMLHWDHENEFYGLLSEHEGWNVEQALDMLPHLRPVTFKDKNARGLGWEPGKSVSLEDHDMALPGESVMKPGPMHARLGEIAVEGM